jgi:hypothetical protein
MALTTGARFGSYEIQSALGAGGMGEVFRARDTRLDRDVAIKILPEAFAHDPERVARFQREAKTLATLNHPNIGGIYGLQAAAGAALVLELVDGPTLADRLSQAGRLPIDEALPIARQIAEALEAAHEHVRITFHPRNPTERCRRYHLSATVERSEVSVDYSNSTRFSISSAVRTSAISIAPPISSPRPHLKARTRCLRVALQRRAGADDRRRQ